MALAQYSIIVCVDVAGGISKEGKIPWTSSENSRFLNDTTTGRGKNAVIMGRKTYKNIPKKVRPLSNRHNIVISQTMHQEENPLISVAESLTSALHIAGTAIKSYDEIFVIGGEQVFIEAMTRYLYLCKKVYITKLKGDHDCDAFFPVHSLEGLKKFKDAQLTNSFTRSYLQVNVAHPEYQYINALKRVQTEGLPRPDRTGVGVVSLFGDVRMEFDLSDSFPLLTTRKMCFVDIIQELLFFIRGETNTTELTGSTTSWKQFTTREQLDKLGLDYEEGDMGPSYGWQWRRWGEKYLSTTGQTSKVGERQGIDQLSKLVHTLSADPFSRRHVLVSYNPTQLPETVLPPGCVFAQFYVSSDKKSLSCAVNLRSAEMFLEVPKEIALYALLTCMLAQVLNYRAYRLIFTLGDAYIYKNHGAQVNTLVVRVPKPSPKLRFSKAHLLHRIEDFTQDVIHLDDYEYWESVPASINV